MAELLFIVLPLLLTILYGSQKGGKFQGKVGRNKRSGAALLAIRRMDAGLLLVLLLFRGMEKVLSPALSDEEDKIAEDHEENCQNENDIEGKKIEPL